MATSSFTKNFALQSKEVKRFVDTLSKKTMSDTLKNFQSKYAHPDKHKEELKRIFK